LFDRVVATYTGVQFFRGHGVVIQIMMLNISAMVGDRDMVSVDDQ